MAAFFSVCALTVAVRALRRHDAPLLLLPAAFGLVAVLSVTGSPFDRTVNLGVITPTPLAVMQWLVSCGFFLIGTITVVDWLRYRGLPRLMLAGSIGLLGVVALFGQAWSRSTTAPQPTGITLTALLLSGFFFFRFRTTLILASPMTVRMVSAAVLIGATVGVAIPLPSDRAAQPHYSAIQAVGLMVVIGVWAFCAGEPCLRLWLHSHALPVVQRMRARYLALGYGGIIAVLVIAVPLILAFEKLQGQPAFTYTLEGVIVASQPLMYFALLPPTWLRRLWRETEEQRFRLATHELLLGTPNPPALASQCLDWAVRLVGAQSGCIVGLDGDMLATSNLSHEQALMLAGASHHEEGRQALRLSPDGAASNVIIVPMRSQFGSGAIAVVAGPFTPLLGSDEVDRLTQYAASVTAAFDRLILLSELTQARAVAENASKRKSEHLSKMSHELRTPMSAILGFAELLSLGDPRDDQRSDINAILTAADHLMALINEVLEIALIESGGGSLSLEPVSVNTVVDESIKLIGRRAQLGNVTLDKQVHSNQAFVLADNQRLRQALVNLLSNAIKYNRSDGSVTVRTTETDSSIRIEVTDTGQGIAPGAADRLFEPFDRMGQERSGIEGTGLGLALTKALLVAMHGTIGFETEQGVGSTFWVEMRRAEPIVVALESAETATGESPFFFRARYWEVLYVEDNLVNVELADRILTQARPNLHLVAASTGAAALAYLEKHRPGLVLLDLHLGDMDGDVVVSGIRANPDLKDLPVVMLSADAGAAQIERLRGMGANEYMTKPFRVKTFLRVVDDALDGSLRSSRLMPGEATPVKS